MADDERPVPIERVSEIFRALADPTRLRILGAIASEARTGRELSELLGLTPPTISHHMARLADAELVRVAPRSQQRFYSLNVDLFNRFQRSSRIDGTTSAESDESSDSEGVAERDKILRRFFDGPRLMQIPAQRKKRVVVLQYLVERFAPNRPYPEREVNDLLREAHEDVATLRRELVDYGYLSRDRGVYRVASSLPPRGATVAQETGSHEHEWLRSLVIAATGRALSAPRNS